MTAPGPPPRRPIACGALGRYERERVLRIARAAEPTLSRAYEGRDAILFLDRPAIEWSSGRRRGFAWSERIDPVAAGGWRSWADAASDGAAAGLVAGARRPHLHSTVSGVAPIYYLEAGGAVYFCSRIDPLIEAAEGELSVDWDAWAAIITWGHPVGERTPFAEVRRLRPFSTLECKRGRARVAEERWPWSEVEPDREAAPAAAAALARMREVVAALPDGPITCPLSGGWDSRLLVGLLAEQGRGGVTTVSASVDDGTEEEERCAAAVARYAGVPNETVAGDPEGIWDDLLICARATDYQRVAQPWMAALVRRVGALGAPSVDGLALDTLGQPGDRLIPPSAIEAGGDREAIRGLMQRHRERWPLRGFRSDFARALTAATRRQVFAESERFAGHPARALLTLYATRTVRGISLVADSQLGQVAAVATPFTDDAVARAVLSASPRAKLGGGLYSALFNALDPQLKALPSMNDGRERDPRTRPIRWQGATAARALTELLPESPMAPHLSPRTTRILAREQRGRAPRVPPGSYGPAFFALWHRRYRERLRPVDPGELLTG